MLIQKDVIEFLISKCSGRTEIEIAEAIFGDGAYQQSVNQDCRMLLNEKKVERRGSGGQSDPFKYYSLSNWHTTMILGPKVFGCVFTNPVFLRE